MAATVTPHNAAVAERRLADLERISHSAAPGLRGLVNDFIARGTYSDRAAMTVIAAVTEIIIAENLDIPEPTPELVDLRLRSRHYTPEFRAEIAAMPVARLTEIAQGWRENATGDHAAMFPDAPAIAAYFQSVADRKARDDTDSRPL